MSVKVNRIEQCFKNRDSGNDKIMSVFLTAGYPDLESTVDLVIGFEKNGADMIELGMPFSDPLADGPTIQESSFKAIENGITMKKIFSMVEEIRKISEIPIILMGYLNPVLHYGIDLFCKDASAAGVDGLIIPDVTMEESGVISGTAKQSGISLIYLAAPNTGSERMKEIDQASEGFVYCVSVTGVTGARDGEEVATSVQKFIERVNSNIIKNPKLIGFGIRSHSDAMKIADKADGFIVGSALIDTIKETYPNKGWEEEVFRFVKNLKYGNIIK